MKRIISAILILCMFCMILVSCGRDKYQNNYIDYEETEINQEGITWPDGQALPTFAPAAENIDAIQTKKGDTYKSMITAFAGVINRKKPRVMIYTENDKKEQWLDYAGTNYTVIKSEEEVILKYKDELSGLVVWDSDVPDTINLATAVAGLKSALIVNEKQLETYSTGEFSLPILDDFRGQFKDKLEVYSYLYDNYWSELSHRLVLGIKPTGWEIRDLAAGANAVILWLNPRTVGESELLARFFADCTPGESFYAGWWDSEGDGVTFSAEYGIPTIPADYYYNYSVYSSMSRELDIPVVPAKPRLENKFYISFTLSDGDNLQYVQHAMRSAGQLWPNKNRGKYPINWTCTAALIDAGPQILNYYYNTATENDFLISGPSGLGYTYPPSWGVSLSDRNTFIKYVQYTDKYFRKTAFNMATIWNQIFDNQAEIYAQNARSLIGLTVQEKFQGQGGDYIVDGKIPLITTSPRYDDDIPRVQSIIEEAVSAWNGESPAFMIPQIVAWEVSGGVPGINKIADALKKKFGDKVEFIRGDHLMMMYNEANGVPYNISLQCENVTASGSDEGYDVSKIADGSFAKDKGWQYSGNGDKYVIIDLGEEYTISRYIVKNAATGYFPEDLNTREFKIQSSMDRDSWKNIDTVSRNKSNIVDKDVDKFNARYVRLYITNQGSDDTARIQEFELYGIKA